MPDDGTSKFLIQRILPANEISLISGSSGAGKTTLALQLMRDWMTGSPVFGCESLGTVRYAIYVACDRSLPSLRRRMHRLGMDPKDYPHRSLVDQLTPRWDGRSIPAAVELAMSLAHAAKLVILDGMTVLCNANINEDKAVAHFLCEGAEYCRASGITVIGTVRAYKSGKSGLVSPQERVIGSTTWAAASETFFDIATIDPTNVSNPKRILSIVPRDSEPMRIACKLEAGGLVEYEDTPILAATPLDVWLAQQLPGVVIRRADVLTAANQLDVKERTAELWLEAQVELSTLERVERGQYRVTSRTPS